MRFHQQVCLLLLVGMVTALTLDAGDVVALIRRAEVRGILGHRDDAINDYRQAVHLQTRPVYHRNQTTHDDWWTSNATTSSHLFLSMFPFTGHVKSSYINFYGSYDGVDDLTVQC